MTPSLFDLDKVLLLQEEKHVRMHTFPMGILEVELFQLKIS